MIGWREPFSQVTFCIVTCCQQNIKTLWLKRQWGLQRLVWSCEFITYYCFNETSETVIHERTVKLCWLIIIDWAWVNPHQWQGRCRWSWECWLETVVRRYDALPLPPPQLPGRPRADRPVGSLRTTLCQDSQHLARQNGPEHRNYQVVYFKFLTFLL